VEGREGKGTVGEGRERTTLHTPCRKFLATPLDPYYGNEDV